VRLAALRLPENPVFSREVRARMRGSRAAWLLFVYLGILSFILFMVYFSWARSQQDDLSGGMGAAAFSIGRTFYEVLFTIQALLVTLITPALTAGGVSIEKEQRTFEMLSVSLLPRRAVVTGKLAAAILFVGLLLTSSLPLVSLSFLLGGVSPGEVAASYASLLAAACVYGAAGMAWSSIARNTTTATVLTYATVFALFLVTLPLAIPFQSGFSSAPGALGLAALNPVGAVALGARQEWYFGLGMPAWAPAAAVNLLLATVFAAVSLHRLEYPKTDRSLLLRALTLALCAAVFTLLGGFLRMGPSTAGPNSVGSVLGNGSFSATARHSFLCWLLAFLPCLIAPIFATGEGLFPLRDSGRKRPRHPWGRWFGEPPSGVAYGVLVTAACGVIVVLTSLGASNAAFGFVGMTAAVAFGLGAVGLVFSALLQNRWTAFAATLAVVWLLCFLSWSTVSGRFHSGAWKPAAVDHLVYLSPFPAALQTADPQREDVKKLARLAGGAPVAAVAGPLYAGLGLVCLPLALLLQRAHTRRATRDSLQQR